MVAGGGVQGLCQQAIGGFTYVGSGQLPAGTDGLVGEINILSCNGVAKNGAVILTAPLVPFQTVQVLHNDVWRTSCGVSAEIF
jgi:hypothetical protein